MSTPPTARLRQLAIDEVSMVDAAAVRDADDPTEPMRFYAMKSERRRKDMGNDRSPDIGTTDAMNDKDELQRQVDDAFDLFLNSPEGRAELQSGRKRESIFASWAQSHGKQLVGQLVAATTAGPASANAVTPQMKRGAQIVQDRAAEAIAKNAREHGVKLTKAQAHRIVQKADPATTAIAMGRAPLADEEA